MPLLVAAFALALAPSPSPGQSQPAAARSVPSAGIVVVDGIEVHLGVAPATHLKSYAAHTVEGSMHGGVPRGNGHYHVNVSLFDAVKRTPITDARVQVQVDEAGMGSEEKLLEPMTINHVTSYGNYFRMAAKKVYRFTVRIRKPGYDSESEARFRPWTQ